MAEVTYEIVEHDGGWAYKLGDVFSEPYETRDAAVLAARLVAKEQRISGDTEVISYQDKAGHWHQEVARGDDRPETVVVTKPVGSPQR